MIVKVSFMLVDYGLRVTQRNRRFGDCCHSYGLLVAEKDDQQHEASG